MASNLSNKKLLGEIAYLSQLLNIVPVNLPPLVSRSREVKVAYTLEYNRLRALKEAKYPTGVSYVAFRGETPPTTESIKKANDATVNALLNKLATIYFPDPITRSVVANPSMSRKTKINFYNTMRERYIAERIAQVAPPAPLIPRVIISATPTPPADSPRQVVIHPVHRVVPEEPEREEKKEHQYFDADGYLDVDILTHVMRANQVRHLHQYIPTLDAIGYYNTYTPTLTLGDREELYIDIAERQAVGVQVATARRYLGIDLNAVVLLKLVYGWKKPGESVELWHTKTFTGELLEPARLLDSIDQWLQTPRAPDSDSEIRFGMFRLFVIGRPAGSCNSSRKELSKRIGEFHITERPSADNNCFFISARELFSVKRIDKNWANTVREGFGLPKDSAISSVNAIKLLERFAPTSNWRIWSFDLPNGKHENLPNPDSQVHEVRLDVNHWTKCEYNPQKKCADCGREYYNKHTCNPKMVSYHMAKVRKYGGGQEAPKFILPNKNSNDENTQANMIHFDIETMPDANRIHQAYAVDYAHRETYGGHRGSGCMKRFIEDVMKIAVSEPDTTFYLNAYNGAKFDMYPLFRELLNMNIKIDKFVVNCGAIIILEFANLKVFDMYKHCQGDLRTNLVNAKCKVLKGDIDHDEIASYGSYENIPEQLKKDIDTYLRADVLGLKELYEKVNEVVHTKYGLNMTSAISTSQLTFKIWTRSLGKTVIQLPTLEQEKDFRQAVLGARCYKTKHNYEAKDYKDYTTGTTKFEDIKEYNAFIDVVSLYPASMAHNMFPTGPCFKTTEEDMKRFGERIPEYDPEAEDDSEEKHDPLPIGIYNIDYIANKKLLHAPCGVKDPVKKSLHWDLSDEKNIFRTSVDIENMRKRGYQVTINHGWYWKTSGPIFKEYIEELYKVKDKAAKDSPEYTLAKLWMNGLYGKMIQRPIYEKTEIVTSNAEYWKFWGAHEITDITEIDETRWSVSGSPRIGKEQVKCITKPTQLGAFILAYSRRIMMNYMIESNPKEKPEDDWDYTDTDSFCVPARCAQLIKRYNGGTLGDIDDDCGHGAKVLKAVYIAPKLYEIWYALPPGTKMKGGKIAEDHKVYRKFAAKGLEKRDLPSEKFEVMANGGVVTTTKSFTFKKIGLSRNSKQQDIPMFSVQHAKVPAKDFIGPIAPWDRTLTREANKTSWSGRLFIGNSSVPHGYVA